MAELPELDIARVHRWCEERVPRMPATRSVSNATLPPAT